ncbi:hypothetical protein S7711_09488 [Stachybotrys chartarum IBT 7711]|uniref:SMP-30/Gluconolactonase/LRE-like region domain-containing protein n=1 Tax=Stachybotrys chartarum (strain CBS 109288 / IBT 7711) TaxID=1280523 RepID=A0A084AFL4_STACB|nr:hypothetical protein S7711_09488 [Stachybotrys chartarum IBT 7711]
MAAHLRVFSEETEVPSDAVVGSATAGKLLDFSDIASYRSERHPTPRSIGQYTFGLDDFAIDSNGTIWACTNLNHTVVALGPSGEFATVAGSSTEITVAGDTSAAFGRRRKDNAMLNVVTSGAWSKPVNGTITEGGKIVTVDTTRFRF